MTAEIKLKYPVDDGGTSIESFKLRRPKVRDMLSSGKESIGDEQKEVNLFATLCDTTPDIISSMDYFDYQKMQFAFNDFLD